MNTKKSHPSNPRLTNEKIAAIDFGSKTFKFVTGFQSKGQIKIKLIKKERINLGKELLDNQGRISDKKLKQIDTLLGVFVKKCKKNNIRTILGIGTSAIRSAKNRHSLARTIKSHGICFEIAKGQREGDIGYLAATHGQPNQLVSDMGSRSFQVSFNINSKIKSVSLKAGYIVVNERFYEGSKTFIEAHKHFRKLLKHYIHHLPKNSQQFRALACNSMACYLKSCKKEDVTNKPISRQLLTRKINALKKLNEKQFTQLKNKLEKADKILPGLTFIDYLLEVSGHKHVYIIEAELPEGLIVEYFLKTNRAK